MTLLQVSKLESCAVTNQIPLTVFDILIANKEKLSHYRTEQVGLWIRLSRGHFPAPRSAAQQPEQQASRKRSQPQPLPVILSPFKIALTHAVYFSNRCAMAKSLARREKNPPQSYTKKENQQKKSSCADFRCAIDLCTSVGSKSLWAHLDDFTEYSREVFGLQWFWKSLAVVFKDARESMGLGSSAAGQLLRAQVQF